MGAVGAVAHALVQVAWSEPPEENVSGFLRYRHPVVCSWSAWGPAL